MNETRAEAGTRLRAAQCAYPFNRDYMYRGSAGLAAAPAEEAVR